MFACGEDEVAPQNAQISMSFNTVTTSTASAGGRVLEGANSLAFTSGYITIREVQFEAETDSDSVEVNLEQITIIDFATGITTPDISGLSIPAGTYREVEVEIELQDDGDQPAVVLNGTFTDIDGLKHPVRFEFNSGETFEVEREGAITFAGGESILAQVTFNPNVWFVDVSNEQLAAATKNAQGVIVISSTQNTNIFNTAADGLDLATEVEISR
ncbi:MAG: hypothetical protein KY428_05780 [Bacteroidetes bacterium]|nr:hypothetical protein [Bacteroidota bacterium]